MRIAIYVRVSTQRQAQTQTIDQQLDRLRKAVVARGWSLPEDHIFRDDGYSGATLRRPGLDRLRDLAALARLDHILVTDPDRLARNYVHQVLLLEELQRHGCRVEFTDRPLSDDPQDQLLLQIRGAVAEYERTLIAERTRRGRLHKLRTGQMLPWTRPPYGYRADPDRPRDPAGVRADPGEAALVAEMFEFYAEEGRSFMAVVSRLHQMGIRSPGGKEYWGQATIRGILSNPTYTGTIYANRTKVRPARVRRSATHPLGRPRDSQEPLPPEQWIAVAQIPAIVTREQFDRVQGKIAQNRSFAKRNNTVTQYLLRALVSCGECQLACQARRTMPTGKTYYICTGKDLQVRRRLGRTCHSKFIPADTLDGIVWDDLSDLLRHPERVAKALRQVAGCALPQELRARLENLKQGRSSLARQIERLTEAYLGDIMSLCEYQRRRKELERRDGTLANQEKILAGEASQAVELDGAIGSAESFAARVSSGLDTATFEQRRQLVELLIDRVVVTGDDVEIRYAFPIGPAGQTGRFCHLRIDYLRRPNFVRGVRGEIPVEHILRHRQAVPGVGRAPELPGRLGPDARLPHQARDRVEAHGVAPGEQLRVHPGAAVAPLELGVDGTDLGRQCLAALAGFAPGAIQPGVAAGGADAEQLAHQPDRPAPAVLLDEGEPHRDSSGVEGRRFF